LPSAEFCGLSLSFGIVERLRQRSRDLAFISGVPSSERHIAEAMLNSDEEWSPITHLKFEGDQLGCLCVKNGKSSFA